MNRPLIAAIDDEEMNLALIQFAIRETDYGFLGIQDSRSAFEALAKHKPTLILMDVQMPHLTGFELCELLKSSNDLKHIPIIFLTGMDRTENKIAGFELGGVDYVTKPFNKHELMARVKTHVNLVLAKQKIVEQTQELERDILLKNRLFSIIGHDLRSPLSAVKMQLDFIQRGIIDTSDPKFVDSTIHNMAVTTDEAFNLLDNLLNWAKSESKVLSIINERLNVKDVVSQNMRLVQMAAKAKEITLKERIPHEIFVFADLNMFKTILRNLLSNAIKFTPKGGSVEVLTTHSLQRVTLTVKDTGTGIAKDDLAKVLDTNAHFTKEGTAEEAGTGLGLVLCQDFINKIGGRLTIESEVGKGSAFSFDLPLMA